MLGTALLRHLVGKHKVFATSRSQGFSQQAIKWQCFDLTNTTLLNKWLDEIRPDVVIHCAAITDVDFCEVNEGVATDLHIKTTKTIANYLTQSGGRLIYISTDSVFDGEEQGAYDEEATTNPLNVYAKTKLAGEQFVRSMDNGLVLRTNIVGWTESKTSFAEWVIERLVSQNSLNLFHDVYFSPLHVDSLSIILGRIIVHPIFGLYHCASRDAVSKYDFGQKIAEVLQLPSLNINKISVKEVQFKANRPKNMALNVEKIGLDLGCELPKAFEAIELMKRQ